MRFCLLCVHGNAHSWFRLKWLATSPRYWRARAKGKLRASITPRELWVPGVALSQAMLLCEQMWASHCPRTFPRPCNEIANPLARIAGGADAPTRRRTDRYLQRHVRDNIGKARHILARRWHGTHSNEAWYGMAGAYDFAGLQLPRPLWFLYLLRAADVVVAALTSWRAWPPPTVRILTDVRDLLQPPHQKARSTGPSWRVSSFGDSGTSPPKRPRDSPPPTSA